jgi:DTW domain-containing protein
MHHRESFRPSSTGNLINRVIPASCVHVWRRERNLSAADIRVPGRDLWILHPNGDPAPAAMPPQDVQVLLLDGSWRETSVMAQEVRSWGRLVRLPMNGESRFWLRAQPDPLRFSTVEALMFLLDQFGLQEAREVLRHQLELHVYASLRARGQKETAHEFLAASPSATAFAAAIAELNVRRSNEAEGGARNA